MPAPEPKRVPVRALPAIHGAGDMELIHQWLADAMGGHPDEIVATDPAQNFRPVIDVEPLMRILGGPWLALVERCHVIKADMRDKRSPDRASHAGEAAEGSFMSVDGQKWRQLPDPKPERKVFDRSASIAMDVAAAAEKRDPIATSDVPLIPPTPGT